MKSFPLASKFGLKISSRIEKSFDQSGVEVVNTISAEEVEAFLQRGSLLYFQKSTDGANVHIRSDKSISSTHFGLLIGETEMPPPCKGHEPYMLEDGTIDPRCKHCGAKLKIALAEEIE